MTFVTYFQKNKHLLPIRKMKIIKKYNILVFLKFSLPKITKICNANQLYFFSV